MPVASLVVTNDLGEVYTVEKIKLTVLVVPERVVVETTVDVGHSSIAYPYNENGVPPVI